MAYLNVRDRRIETKIAYVGPELAGKATNLHTLTKGVRGRATNVEETITDGGALFSLDWTPLAMPRWRDCELAVKVVAARGALSAERMKALLDDVDGVVVVVDADPEAQAQNRRAVQLVKELVDRATPVVVQANKSDLAGAIGADALATALETNEWPVVPASATRGEGVVETLEMALTNVLEAMKREHGDEPEVVKADHNPLLTALRQILRETVTEHMAGLEASSRTRLESALATKLEAHVTRIEERFDRIERAILASAEVEGRLARVIAEAESRLGRTLEASEAKLARTIAESEAQLREEVTTRAKADREHVVAALAVVRRGVDAVAVDVKKQDGRDLPLMEKIDASIALVRKDLLPTTAVPARLQSLEQTIHRELRETFGPRLARIDDSVQVLHVDAGESFARSDARIGEIQSGLSELLEELKRRKKGWFS